MAVSAVKGFVAYRFLTGEDSSAFCHKVTAALAQGWQLYGNPTYAHDPKTGTMLCGQAVVKEVEGTYDPATKLRDL